MEAIVLAGGFGTRLAPVLRELPKPMAPIGNRVFLELVLRNLKQSGFTDIILSLGYKADVIQKFVGTNFVGLRIQYAIEAHPLGTGGAIRAALAFLRGSQALVLNGDTYVDLDYVQMIRTHRHFKRRITIAAVEVSNMSRYGQLLLQDDTVIGFNTKPIAGPGLINAGIYVVDKSIFDGTPCNTSFSFEKDFLAANVFVLRPHVYKTSAYFIDIGVAEDYARAQRELAFQ